MEAQLERVRAAFTATPLEAAVDEEVLKHLREKTHTPQGLPSFEEFEKWDCAGWRTPEETYNWFKANTTVNTEPVALPSEQEFLDGYLTLIDEKVDVGYSPGDRDNLY
jgi:hypothetical protein